MVAVYSTVAQDYPNGSTSNPPLAIGAVPPASAIWVFVANNDPLTSGDSVTDGLGNIFVAQRRQSDSGGPPGVELWVADNVVGGTSDQIQYTRPSGTGTAFSLAVIVFTGQATPSVRAFGSGGGGNFTNPQTVMDSAISAVPNGLYLLAMVIRNNDYSPGATWSGASGSSVLVSTPGVIPGSPPTPTNIALGIFNQRFPASKSNQVSGTATDPAPDFYSYFCAVVAAPTPQWDALLAGPFYTVSPIGQATTGIANNGADFGPDTPATQTSGIQEALIQLAADGGGTIVCLQGTYVLNAAVAQTGNDQTVVFEPGCIINIASGANLNIGGPSGAVIFLVGANTDANHQANYSRCRWYGNGCVINRNAAQVSTADNTFAILNWGYQNGSSPPPPSSYLLIDDFDIVGVLFNAVWVGVNTYDTTTPDEQMRYITVSRISATFYPAVQAPPSTSAAGIRVEGCVRQLLIDQVDIDATGVTTSGADLDGLLIRSNAGETQEVVVRRSRFKSNGKAGGGSCIELQGNAASASGHHGQDIRNTHEVVLEDCVFDTGWPPATQSPIVKYQGDGGLYVDDNNGQGTLGWIYNLEFRRCLFLPWSQTSPSQSQCGIGFQSNSTGAPFGYLRLADGSVPGGFSGSLSQRGPNDIGIPAAILAGVYTNLDGFDEDVIVSGGTPGTNPAIRLNGYATGLLNGVFRLRESDTLTFVNWTLLPALQKQSR
jgi:hypothetical protein